MRFIAIYNQHQIPHTRGFPSSIEALDFLFWGYEDQCLLPYGIYDQLTELTIPYTHAGQRIHSIPAETICSMAKPHLALKHRPALLAPSQTKAVTTIQ